MGGTPMPPTGLPSPRAADTFNCSGQPYLTPREPERSVMQTVVHVTHEAIQKIGGIGAVLHGLLTSRVYLEKATRNILVGAFWPSDERGERRLGPQGEVLYSSLDHLYRSPLASRFREIEEEYDVGI